MGGGVDSRDPQPLLGSRDVEVRRAERAASETPILDGGKEERGGVGGEAENEEEHSAAD